MCRAPRPRCSTTQLWFNKEIEVVARSPELMAKLAADFVDPRRLHRLMN